MFVVGGCSSVHSEIENRQVDRERGGQQCYTFVQQVYLVVGLFITTS